MQYSEFGNLTCLLFSGTTLVYTTGRGRRGRETKHSAENLLKMSDHSDNIEILHLFNNHMYSLLHVREAVGSILCSDIRGKMVIAAPCSDLWGELGLNS